MKISDCRRELSSRLSVPQIMLTGATIIVEFELSNQGWITALVGAPREPWRPALFKLFLPDTSSSGSQLLLVSRGIRFVIKLHLQLNAVASQTNDPSRARRRQYIQCWSTRIRGCQLAIVSRPKKTSQSTARRANSVYQDIYLEEKNIQAPTARLLSICLQCSDLKLSYERAGRK